MCTRTGRQERRLGRSGQTRWGSSRRPPPPSSHDYPEIAMGSLPPIGGRPMFPPDHGRQDTREPRRVSTGLSVRASSPTRGNTLSGAVLRATGSPGGVPPTSGRVSEGRRAARVQDHTREPPARLPGARGHIRSNGSALSRERADILPRSRSWPPTALFGPICTLVLIYTPSTV